MQSITDKLAAALRAMIDAAPGSKNWSHKALTDATRDAIFALAEYDQQADGLPTEYRVTWEIDAYDATTPREAAQEAREAMQRAYTTATVFTVYGRDGTVTVVDLSEEENDNA